MGKPWAIFPAIAVLTVTGAGMIRAQEAKGPDPSNEAIFEIVDSRALRLPALQTYKAGGVIGENNRGLIEVMKPPDDAEELERLRVVVIGENTDRKRLYRILAENSGPDPAELDKVRTDYAELLRESALPGEWIQLPDGRWEKKEQASDAPGPNAP